MFVDFAYRRPDRVAVIGLRQVFDVDRPKIDLSAPVRGAVDAAVVGAPNGEELLPLVRAALGIGQPREGSAGDWGGSQELTAAAASRSYAHSAQITKTFNAMISRDHIG